MDAKIAFVFLVMTTVAVNGFAYAEKESVDGEVAGENKMAGKVAAEKESVNGEVAGENKMAGKVAAEKESVEGEVAAENEMVEGEVAKKIKGFANVLEDTRRSPSPLMSLAKLPDGWVDGYTCPSECQLASG